MIRKSIEPGTKVFHLDHGIGTFIKWSEDFEDIAITKYEQFKGVTIQTLRKNLTEIVDEKSEFNPPV